MTQLPPLTDEQLDDVLDALAGPATFSVDDLAAARRHTLAAVDPVAPTAVPVPGDVVPLVPRPPATHRRRRRGMAVLIAAAVLVVVATLTVALLQARRSSDTVPAAGRAEIVCLVDPDHPTPAATDRARALVTARLAVLGGTGPVTASEVTPQGADRLLVSADGIDRDGLADLCTSPQPALRPLLTAPIGVETPPEGTVVSLAASPFPTSDTAFAALPSPYRAEIEKALRYGGCPSTSGSSATISVMACDRTDAPSLAYLLGPAIVAPGDIVDATADAPVAGGSGWTVDVTFGPAGVAALSRYTQAHNTGGVSSPATATDTCGRSATPCSDFLAIVVSGTVASAPLILSTVTGNLQVTGAFDRAGATLLAAGLAAGDLTLLTS